MRLVLFMLGLILATGIAAVAVAAETEGDVLDASGKVVLAGPAKASDIPALIGFLKKGGVEARYAKDILADMGEDAEPALIEALKEGAGFNDILDTLGRIGDEKSVRAIAQYINDPSWDRANAARGTLRRVGNRAVPVVVEMMGDKDYNEAVIAVLISIKPDDDSIRYLRTKLDSPNPLERGGAARILGLWNDKDSGAAIKKLLGDSEQSVRESAIIGYIDLYKDEPSGYDKDLLISLLKDPSIEVRREVIYNLSLLPGGTPVEPLIDMLKTATDKDEVSDIVVKLGESGDQRAVFPLIEYLQRKDLGVFVLTHVIYALGAIKSEEAIPYFNDILKSDMGDNLDVQRETFIALKNIGKPLDLRPYLKYLKYGDKHSVSTPQLLEMFEEVGKPGDSEVLDALEKFRDRLTWKGDKATLDRIINKLK